MNSLPIIEGLAQNTATKTLFEDIQNFNTVYERYAACNNSSTNPSNTILNCKSNEMSADAITAAYNKLVSTTGSFAQFQKAMQIPSGQAAIDKNENVMDYYNTKIVKPREELEEKMQILKDVSKSVEKDYSIKYDSTMVTSTLVTITASCVLFYVFMHIE
jgi:hypothetical protein